MQRRFQPSKNRKLYQTLMLRTVVIFFRWRVTDIAVKVNGVRMTYLIIAISTAQNDRRVTSVNHPFSLSYLFLPEFCCGFASFHESLVFTNLKKGLFKFVKNRDFPIFHCLECRLSCMFICVLHSFQTNHCKLANCPCSCYHKARHIFVTITWIYFYNFITQQKF